jgi:ferric-dicitrate binding protein FerR (iron transport regulator)
MILSLQEAQKFVNQFVKGEYTPEEHAAFLQWLQGATTVELKIISDMHESMHDKWVLAEGPSAAWVMQLEQKLNESNESREEEETGRDDRGLFIHDQQPLVFMRPLRKRWWNIGVSAAAVVVVVTGTYLYVQQTGSKLGKRADREKLLSMTFVNPRGGAQKEMILADGSKVWLEADSKLKYPPQFTGSERLVELSGEAFFDVAGNAERPFRVLIKDAEVEVLGTFFTVMAYDDEPENRTAVVNGAVKVTTDQGSATLKAGDEEEVIYASRDSASYAGAGVPVRGSSDPNFLLAWKNGIYQFKSKELSVVMREVARAYNVKVEVQPSVANQRIGGSLDLSKGLDFTLKRLEDATEPFHIHFHHNGNTIIASTI